MNLILIAILSIQNSLRYPLYSKCRIQFPSHILLFSIARSMYSLPFPVSYCESPSISSSPAALGNFSPSYTAVLPVSIIFIPYAAHKAIYRCAREMAVAEKKYLYADLENKSHVIWRCARWRASWYSLPLSHSLLLSLLLCLAYLCDICHCWNFGRQRLNTRYGSTPTTLYMAWCQGHNLYAA